MNCGINRAKEEFDNTLNSLISFYNEHYKYDVDSSIKDSIQIYTNISETGIPNIDYDDEFVIIDALNGLLTWPRKISTILEKIMLKMEEKYNDYELEYRLYNHITRELI